jgi:hypothetical protein
MPTAAVAPATTQAVAPAITPQVEAAPLPTDAAAPPTVASTSAELLESAALPLRGISNAFLRERPPSASTSAPGTPLPPHEPNPGGSAATAVPGSGMGISGPAIALFGLLGFIVGQLILRVRIGQDPGIPTVVLPVLEHPG